MPNIGALSAQQNMIREFKTGGNPALARLRPGDTLDAEVIRTEQGQPALQLPDGTQVSVSSGQDLPVGQMLRLTVTGRMAGSVTVELSDSSGSQTTARADLQSQRLEPSPVNLRLAQALRDAGLPVTRDTVTKLGEALSAHPTLSPEQAVFMTENKMPITARNVASFQAFARQEAVIGNTLGKLMSVLAEIDPPAPQTEGSGQAPVPQTEQAPQTARSLRLMQDVPMSAQKSQDGMRQADLPQQPALTGTILTQTEQAPQTAAQTTVSPQSEQAAQLPQQPVQTGMAPELAEAVLPEQAPQTAAQTSALSQQEQTAQNSQQPVQTQTASTQAETLPPEQASASAVPAQTEQAVQTRTIPTRAETSQPEQASSPAVSTQPEQTADSPQQTAQTRTATVRTDAPPQAEQATSLPQSVQTETASPQALQTAEHKEREQTIQAPAEKDMSLLDKVSHLFRKVSRDRAGVLPRELDAPRLMRELTEVLQGLEEKASTLTGSARESLQQVARELESGVKFMSQLNNFTAFVQLPVTVNGERTTADLYVFNDSKSKKKIDPENATLFLSLGTVNAGRIETFVKVIGKNVECDFYTETEEVSSLVRGEMQSLLKLLSAQGFKLQRTTSGLQQSPSDVLDVRRGHDALASKYKFNALA